MRDLEVHNGESLRRLRAARIRWGLGNPLHDRLPSSVFLGSFA